MPADLLLMSDPLIRRSRLNCATQAQIISLDIRFIPPEHELLARPEAPSACAAVAPKSFFRRYQYGLKMLGCALSLCGGAGPTR